LRNNELAQNVQELVRENFLARVGFRAFPPVPCTVIVHIPMLFQLSDEQASAVSALNQPAEGEIVFYFSGFGLSAFVQKLLNTLPTVTTHQRFMGALVGDAIPVEIAHVQAIAQDLMYKAVEDPSPPEGYALSSKFSHQSLD
jgi:hypothetical protein